MEDKEIKIIPPEGYEIDESKSTFDCIKFKKKVDKFRGSGKYIKGYRPSIEGTVQCCTNFQEGGDSSHLIFSTKKEAESALAMAQISQIIANDKRFGGPITEQEWVLDGEKYCLVGRNNHVVDYESSGNWNYFLAFHTKEQRKLFFEENEDLVKQFLMVN